MRIYTQILEKPHSSLLCAGTVETKQLHSISNLGCPESRLTKLVYGRRYFTKRYFFSIFKNFNFFLELANMKPEEMASNELKKLREKFTKEAINDHQMAQNEGKTGIQSNTIRSNFFPYFP